MDNSNDILVPVVESLLNNMFKRMSTLDIDKYVTSLKQGSLEHTIVEALLDNEKIDKERVQRNAVSFLSTFPLPTLNQIRYIPSYMFNSHAQLVTKYITQIAEKQSIPEEFIYANAGEFPVNTLRWIYNTQLLSADIAEHIEKMLNEINPRHCNFGRVEARVELSNHIITVNSKLKNTEKLDDCTGINKIECLLLDGERPISLNGVRQYYHKLVVTNSPTMKNFELSIFENNLTQIMLSVFPEINPIEL